MGVGLPPPSSLRDSAACYYETAVVFVRVRAPDVEVRSPVVAAYRSQILKAGGPSMSRHEVGDRTWDITQWVGDALRPHAATFAGRMTFPPYPRRRSAPATTNDPAPERN